MKCVSFLLENDKTKKRICDENMEKMSTMSCGDHISATRLTLRSRKILCRLFLLVFSGVSDPVSLVQRRFNLTSSIFSIFTLLYLIHLKIFPQFPYRTLERTSHHVLVAIIKVYSKRSREKFELVPILALVFYREYLGKLSKLFRK